MALKRLNTIAENASKSTKDEIPVIRIPGDIVSTFNAAVKKLKEAEADQKSLRARLLEIGLDKLFEANVNNPTAPLTSIKLMQANESAYVPAYAGDALAAGADAGDGETCRLSFQEKYSAADADTADALFTDLLKEQNKGRKPKDQLTINNFMQETITAGFNSGVFHTGDKKEFNHEIFDAYAEAIATATTKLIAKGKLPVGTNSPLATTKKVLPLANFHSDRWRTFPTVVAQNQLFEVVSNTVTITPVIETLYGCRTNSK